ncbi:uncharacterized protein LOC114880719 [Osmia bicornis bicornis]|uniref:uncharacterized protein LOC114880719 n=1 Tax=Osmia bicornis bicornis TaxID=1437191 RepID=UPI001EAF6949|nr:uncharacterized protein LOC114880719 [Osmia bicornis bicornis]
MCCSLTTVLVIIAMDSLYMVIFHYICGVFALCGYQIKKAAEISKSDIEGGTFENGNKKDLFRRCVMTHYEAIKFYDYMNDSTRTSYLFQVGLNMLGITSTAVQAVMNFDRPEEAFRIIMFLLGQQFHLYTLSLPGQVLMDRSFELSNDIYCSKWHEIPVKFQKVLHIMLIRSSKPCRLSAGGLYEMNIENFGTIFKTCMSYFTILLSLREKLIFLTAIQRNNRNRDVSVYDIPDYKVLKKFLKLSGLDPYQEDAISTITTYFMICSVIGMVIPTFLGFYTSVLEKDMDQMFESVPYLTASSACIVKILNVHLNKSNFRKLLNLVVKEWEQLKDNDELEPLEKLTKRASYVANLYRNCLLWSMVIFLSLTILPSVLDVVLPLNETRPREQLFNVNYLVFDGEDYYYFVYLQLGWSTFVCVIIIGTVDSLYIIVIHHSSGMFVVCGKQFQKATEMADMTDGNEQFNRFRRCIISHTNALQFYEILNETSTTSYLFQVGINMIGISVTAVQVVLCLDRPDEATKATVHLVSKQFHLFIISLPGQVLLDHCAELATNIYCSKWYKAPVRIRKMIQIMQMRSSKPCALSAGGLYEMSIENFGNTMKTCMSYVTMLLSFKE